MTRMVAFLRGINVSGQNIIKMEALRQVMNRAGYQNVATYIQSGNLLFDTEFEDEHQIIQSLEDIVFSNFKFHADIILRKKSHIETFANSAIVQKLIMDETKKYYITFLKTDSEIVFQQPIYSKNKDIEIVHFENRELISVSSLYKGNYGFPNAFIEKFTGIPATTRNPKTLERILNL